MAIWKDIKTAPLGEYVEVKKGKYTLKRHIPTRVIIWVVGHGWMVSTWLPEQGRWEGTSKENNTVTHWLDIEPPKEQNR